MRIVFTGPSFVRRVVEPYSWEPGPEPRVQEVADPALAAELLTLPGSSLASGEFVLAKDEPLAALGLTLDQIVTLALEAKVASVSDLAALRPTTALADALAAPLSTLKRWVADARAHTTPEA